ncbi:MAG: hypothetical protein CL478_12575 [Acidobacteria bacterium]|nr:hypothetical protein [Acidobacteriota bacterium]
MRCCIGDVVARFGNVYQGFVQTLICGAIDFGGDPLDRQQRFLGDHAGCLHELANGLHFAVHCAGLLTNLADASRLSA